jgi:hypothetical protein
VGSWSQLSFLLILRSRPTPVTFFQGLPCVLRNSGVPEPAGAVAINLRTRSATSTIHSAAALVIALGRLCGTRRGRFTLPLAVSPRLLPSTPLARRTGPILLIGQPPRPAPRCQPTRHAAIAAAGVMGYEPLFAPFQKAKTGSRAAGAAPLILRRRTGIMKGAQGRSCSREVKSRGEAATSPRDAFLFAPASWPPTPLFQSSPPILGRSPRSSAKPRPTPGGHWPRSRQTGPRPNRRRHPRGQSGSILNGRR